MYRASYRAAWLSALFLPVVQLISAVAVGAIVWYGGLQAEVGGLTIGGIQAFVSYITFMLWPIQDMARVYAEMQHAIASAERVFSLVDAVPDVTDQPGAVGSRHDPRRHRVRRRRFLVRGRQAGAARFQPAGQARRDHRPGRADRRRQVDHRQPGLPLLRARGGHDPHRRARLPRAVAARHPVAHRRGAANAAPVLRHHPREYPLRPAGRHRRRDRGRGPAGRRPRASSATLEKGYDEEVGEGGDLLSVGQKQLVSLARAVLAQPEIFIMDEATSSVDTLTEDLIQRGMEALMHDRTSFVIAHRLSTIKRADRILVIDEGRIVEMGSHAELLRQRGHYYRLYTRQFRQKLEEEFDPFKASVPVLAAARA